MNCFLAGSTVSKVRDQWPFYENSSDMTFANEHFQLATKDGFYVEVGPSHKHLPTYRKCNNFTAFKFVFIDHKTAQPVPSPVSYSHK